MKRIYSCHAFLLTALPVAAGDAVPLITVRMAAQKLADASGYSWRVTASSGDKGRFMPGPIDGQAEKGGCTHWSMSFGDRSVEAFLKEGRAAVKTEDGWVRPEDQKPRPPLARSGSDGGKKHHSGKAGFLAARLQSMKTPAEMAGDLAGKVKELKAEGAVISGELTREAVGELLAFGGPNRKDGGAQPEPVNPTGSVKFWLKDGLLQKMEVRVGASVTLNGNEVVIDRTTVIEIKDAGTTKMEVPVEARKLIETGTRAIRPEAKPA